MIAENQITTARVPFAGPDIPSDDIISSCVHCGLCLPACPTYRETGLEMSSPRGRIYLMKAVADGRIGMEADIFQEQMSQCLNCRACEAVCPSGVQYGAILEASRTQIEQARDDGRLPPHPWLVQLLRGGTFGVLFKRLSLFRLFSRLMWLYQRSGVQMIARRSGALKLLKLDDTEALLPPISDRFTVPQGQRFPAEGTARFHVALLPGCIMSTAFAGVHEATIRVLQKNGCTVYLPPEQGCCGALHSHGGDLEGARELARRNIAAFAGLGLDAVIVNAAGCGSTLKEYGHLLHDDPAWAARAATFTAKVRDVSEFLAGAGLNTTAMRPLDLRVTYQEPCHLAHAQRISAEPRALIRAIPGVELIEMHEPALCCGSAGIYNITEPAMAARLGERKLNNAEATSADVLITANPGCHLQLAGGLRRRDSAMQVKHIVELLDEAYGK
ncbi:MAG: 4Fe-4S dicluster domain-containing protein [Chloroflexales bacterium]|nr:4Fe-4S dicluster domain-containing protein [Chloroflexales bacterium]